MKNIFFTFIINNKIMPAIYRIYEKKYNIPTMKCLKCNNNNLEGYYLIRKGDLTDNIKSYCHNCINNVKIHFIDNKVSYLSTYYSVTIPNNFSLRTESCDIDDYGKVNYSYHDVDLHLWK